MANERSGIGKAASFVSGFASRVIVLALMVLAIFIAVRFSFSFGHSIFYQEAAEQPPGTDVEVTIDRGASIDELAAELYEDGIISNALAFRIQGRLYRISFYPGTYTLNTSMTTKEILKTIDMTREEYEESRAQAAAAAEEAEDGVLGGGSEGE